MDVCINSSNSYWPQIVDYEQILNENPDSIFILNKRDLEELLDSFKRWRRFDRRLFTYSPGLVKDKTDKEFINFVNDFYKDIETCFTRDSNSEVMSHDINNDTIESLKKYIAIKDIKSFPKNNVSKS